MNRIIIPGEVSELFGTVSVSVSKSLLISATNHVAVNVVVLASTGTQDLKGILSMFRFGACPFS